MQLVALSQRLSQRTQSRRLVLLDPSSIVVVGDLLLIYLLPIAIVAISVATTLLLALILLLLGIERRDGCKDLDRRLEIVMCYVVLG